MSTDIEMGGILFLHGLESSPQGTKARWLRDKFGAVAVDLDTSAAIALRDQAVCTGLPWDHRTPALQEAFETPMQRTLEAIATYQPCMIIGSSFGGAVLLKLLCEGHWSGLSLFIASAGLKLTPHRQLPKGQRMLFLHGTQDKVVPIVDSQTIALTGGPGVQLWEIIDDHRMSSILVSGTLMDGIAWLLAG